MPAIARVSGEMYDASGSPIKGGKNVTAQISSDAEFVDQMTVV